MGTTGNSSQQDHPSLATASTLRAVIPISAAGLFVCVLSLAATSLALGEAPKTVRGRSLERFPYAMPELRPTQPVDKALAELGQHSLQRAVEHLQSITTSDVSFTITLFSEEIPDRHRSENSGGILLQASQQKDFGQGGFRQFSKRYMTSDGQFLSTNKLVQSPKGMLFWEDSSNRVISESSITTMSPLYGKSVVAVDINSCPFWSITNIMNDMICLSDITNGLTKDKIIAVSQEKDGRIVTTWSLGKEVAYSLATDSQQGGLPVISCVWVPKRPGFEIDGPFTEQEVIFTDWEMVDETPVPVKLRQFICVRSELVETEFSWVSANKPLDATLFTIETMQLPEGTRLMNVIDGHHIFSGVIDSEGKVSSPFLRRSP